MDENVRQGVKGHRRRMRIRKKKEKNVGISSYERRFLNSSFSSFFSLVKKKSWASSLYELACFFNCCLFWLSPTSSLAEVAVITVITNMIVTSLSLMRNVQRKLFNLTHPLRHQWQKPRFYSRVWRRGWWLRMGCYRLSFAYLPWLLKEWGTRAQVHTLVTPMSL